MDWLSDNYWLGWLGLALVLGAVEAVTVDFIFLMLAGGALAGALAAGLGAPLTVQALVAILSSLVLLVAVRPVIKRQFTDGVHDHAIGPDALVGREARVLDTVTEHGGLVKLSGENWTARTVAGSPPCPTGSSVSVVAIQGATALVTQTALLPGETPHHGVD